jgi:hypothetical protein
MQISKIEDSTNDEPLKGEMLPFLLLLALAPFGLLIWTGLFLIVQWSVLTIWALAVALVVAA